MPGHPYAVTHREPPTCTEAARHLERLGFAITLSPDHRSMVAKVFLVRSGCRVDRDGWEIRPDGRPTNRLAIALVVTAGPDGWRVCTFDQGRGRSLPVDHGTAALAWASRQLRIYTASRASGGGGWNLHPVTP